MPAAVTANRGGGSAGGCLRQFGFDAGRCLRRGTCGCREGTAGDDGATQSSPSAARISTGAADGEPLRARRFQSGTMREDIGGGAFNALRNAVRQRRGRRAVVDARRRCGRRRGRAGDHTGPAYLDLSAVFLDRATPSYTALLDSEGDVVAALADMVLYEIAFPKQIRRAKVREEIAVADAVLCDANLPAAGSSGWRRSPKASRCSQSPSRRPRRCGWPDAAGAPCLYMNRREAAALAGMGGRRLRRGGRGDCGRSALRAASSPRARRRWSGSSRRHHFARAAGAAERSPTSPAPAMRWPARRRSAAARPAARRGAARRHGRGDAGASRARSVPEFRGELRRGAGPCAGGRGNA